jgi:hypothetical protein
MAKKINFNNGKKDFVKKVTSIGSSKRSNRTRKARNSKRGVKRYRGQGR